MEGNKYKYKSGPLAIAVAVFLVGFPLVFGGLVWALGLFRPVYVYSLAGLYACDLIVLGWIALNSWDKYLMVSPNALGFYGKVFKREFKPKDLLEITLLAYPEGREYLRLRTRRKTYFLDEQYQPWNRLLLDLENLAQTNGINSNLID